ncbi:MAG: hypothetical protein P9L90_02055 [Candidatus Aadella gelida]|nr:hypothetical protein [Candidatus Aadella gelida]
MPHIKDDLGREFVSLPILSSVLNLSTKQVRRHIRDKRMLSIKRGQRRYVAKEDILREYPSISNESLNRDIGDISMDKRDTIGTSTMENDVSKVPNVYDVPVEKEITLFQQDQKTDMMLTKIEQVKTVITKLEKSIADIGYIQQDTKTLDRKLERITSKLSLLDGQKGHRGHKIYLGVLVAVVLAVIGTSVYGILQFKELHKESQEKFDSNLSAKDKEVTTIFANYTEHVNQYDRKTREQNIELAEMKILLDQKKNQVQILQDTLTKQNQNKESAENERGESDGYKNPEVKL